MMRVSCHPKMVIAGSASPRPVLCCDLEPATPGGSKVRWLRVPDAAGGLAEVEQDKSAQRKVRHCRDDSILPPTASRLMQRSYLVSSHGARMHDAHGVVCSQCRTAPH